MEVVVGAQQLAHLLGRPELDLAAKVFGQKPDQGLVRAGMFNLGDLEPAGCCFDTCDGAFGERCAYVIEAALR